MKLFQFALKVGNVFGDEHPILRDASAMTAKTICMFSYAFHPFYEQGRKLCRYLANTWKELSNGHSENDA